MDTAHIILVIVGNAGATRLLLSAGDGNGGCGEISGQPGGQGSR